MHRLNSGYNSDGERGRLRQLTAVSYFQQYPSPPPLNRTKSTGRDQRLHPVQYRQEPLRNKGAKTAEGFQHLSAKKPYNYHEHYVGYPESSSPTFAWPPVPKIIVSKPSRLDSVQHHRSGGSWTERAHIISQPTSPASSASGLLGVKTYQYEELRPLEFRLVRIFAKKMSTVKCEIIHSPLTEPPPYTAISYAWGDADDTRPIQIGSINIPIAVSLFGALDALRKREEDVLVWADALCIDQQNSNERSQQVQLMTEIYAKATQVAIWLGPSDNDSELAKEFLQDIIMTENYPEDTTALLLSPTRLRAVKAVVRLFQRDYWRRLWVVQEVFNAKSIKVYCGDSTGLPWGVYRRAACIFQTHKKELDSYFSASPIHGVHLAHFRVLAYEGPNSLSGFESLNSLGEESLLNVVRACRRKLTRDPRDRIFGVLGVLPEVVRQEFPVNYSLSVKEIYTDVVDFVLYATERLDVICESIHFPKQTSATNLPSWVPDWSQNPDITALCYAYNFAAADNTSAKWVFLGERRNELEISAVFIGTVWKHGVAVGTLCTLADYLMAFLHWRAILLDLMSSGKRNIQEDIEEAFCRTLCLGQVLPNWKPDEWMEKCYRVFATQVRNRLPQMPIDEVLKGYIDNREDAESNHRQFLQSHFGSRMMGRCFFLTKKKSLGMGTGFMLPGDVIVVPLGCGTPIIIREEDDKPGRFRFVGDAYLDGFMNGQAIQKWKAGETDVQKFVLI